MLSNLITRNNVLVDMESTEKEEALAELLEVLVAGQPQIDRREALESLSSREDKMSTAVMPHIAVPHAVCSSVKKTAVALGISRNGIEFDLPDSPGYETTSVNIIFETLFAEKETETHLHLLRDILYVTSNPEFLPGIRRARTAQDVCDLICSLEA